MPRKGLSHEEIMQAAIILVEEKGYDHFSLRELASRLHVKPASLYNHVAGIDEIGTAIAKEAVKRLKKTLTIASSGKEPDEAFLSAARAYRRFASNNQELYNSIIRMPETKDAELTKASLEGIEPLRAIIMSYGVKENSRVHFMRSIRSALHGFVSLEAAGFMRLNPVPIEESFEAMIQVYLQALKTLSKEGIPFD